jgi:DNA segregation ATPase FtsK/SpoIIIE, S-DNA-T family
MNWLKKMIAFFKAEDIYESIEEVAPAKEQPIQITQQIEKKKDIEARVAYHYPKGQFRFPLIPDEEPKRKRPPRKASHVKEERNTRPVSSSELSSTSERKESISVQRKPFQPTEIPSPIYGFQRPKQLQTVEPMFRKAQEVEPASKPILEEVVTQTKNENEHVMPVTESISHQYEQETTVYQEKPFEHPVAKEAGRQATKIVKNDVEQREQPVEQLQPKAIELKDETEVTVQEPKIAAEKLEKERPRRKTIPFNVIMLKQDKERLQKQSPIQQTKRPIEKQDERQPAPSSQPTHTRVSNEGDYHLPSIHYLTPPVQTTVDKEWVNKQAHLLNDTLKNFNVRAKVVHVTQGPSVTRFEVQPEPGVKVNKITNLADDIKLSLAAKDIRIEAPIPGKHTIGIEVPNRQSRPVFLSEIIGKPMFLENESPLTVALGLDIAGQPVIADLQKMPHGLIAGATGSGKSVCINTMLVSLLFKATPEQLRLLLIDPKMVELAPYNRIPHLISPVITDVKAATAALRWAVEEMERRYELFAQIGARDLKRYNQLAEREGREHLPYIVIVIDELADLMMVSPADVEEAICRIAQKARACGIHLIVATQRPSVDVITGLIKANIPTRIAFSVSSQADSRTIIDMGGAEKLLGKGDMLYLGNGSSKPVRLQGTFVSDEEIDEIVQHVRKQREPSYLFAQEELMKKSQSFEEEDELFYEACEFVVEQGGASTSSLQRRFRIGYNRAARLIDMMEQHGIISEAKGSKPRDVLISEQDLETILDTSTIS